MAATGNGSVKAELGVPGIKVEGENGPEPVEGFDEDAELHFPGPDDPSQAWLVKVPDWLWTAWFDMQATTEDEVVEIGKVRVYHNDRPDADTLKQKIEMRLNPTLAHHREIPQNFELAVETSEYNNTSVFSEKDLPGHKPQKYGADRSYSNKPKGINKHDRYAQNNQQANSQRQLGTAGYRSGVPKEVHMAPMIEHEATAIPLKDASFERFQAAKMQDRYATDTEFLQGIQRRANAGRDASAIFDGFTSERLPVRKGRGKKASQKEKAVRMPQAELTDAIYKCFREFRYWPLRVLRKKLGQPEAYIKETLEQVAILVRTGDMANTWKLKPEYAVMADVKDEVVKDEVVDAGAGVLGDDEDMGTGDEMGTDEDDDEDDADMGFEDVNM